MQLQSLLKKIPAYAVVSLLVILLFNCSVYFLTSKFMVDVHHYDFTTSFDRAVPVLPSWVYIYIICYAFWGIGYIVIVSQSKKHCYQFVTAELMAKAICLLCFVFLPTTNVRPVITDTTFAGTLLKYVYLLDRPVNLFPSIHCLVSWFCYIGIRGRKNIPLWYRYFSCIFAIMVCISTQVTKQHYIIDFIGAIAVSETTWYIATHTKLYNYTQRAIEKITDILLLTKKQEV